MFRFELSGLHTVERESEPFAHLKSLTFVPLAPIAPIGGGFRTIGDLTELLELTERPFEDSMVVRADFSNAKLSELTELSERGSENLEAIMGSSHGTDGYSLRRFSTAVPSFLPRVLVPAE